MNFFTISHPIIVYCSSLIVLSGQVVQWLDTLYTATCDLIRVTDLWRANASIFSSCIRFFNGITVVRSGQSNASCSPSTLVL